MLQLILTVIAPFAAILLLIGYVKYRFLAFEGFIDDFQASLENIAAEQAQNVKEVLAEPTVKRAMGIIGARSGEVRADKALRTKVANIAVEQSPLLGKVLEAFNLTPLEGLKILNDPLIRPMIEKFAQGQGLAATNPGQRQGSEMS